MNNPIIIKGNKIYTKSKNVKFDRFCNKCKKHYIGWGKEFCSKKCRIMPKGEDSPFWKGDNITKQTGRYRAEKLFKIKPCEKCGKRKSERHHIDSNPINNHPSNIMFLCRKHHFEIENRIIRLLAGRRSSSSVLNH